MKRKLDKFNKMPQNFSIGSAHLFLQFAAELPF